MITRDGAKMSKSKGNMISPVPYVERYGADTARCYILFIGPPDHDVDWTDKGVEGVHRFLVRLWRLGADVAAASGRHKPLGPLDEPKGADLELMRKAHWAIDKVTEDMAGRFAFNTAIAAVMELVNEAYRHREEAHASTLHFAAATAASLVFPFAPHTGSDVYDMLTGDRVWEQPWPEADPELLKRDTVDVVVQVNGKLRDRVQAGADASEEELLELARSSEKVQRHLDGVEVVKEVVVPGKLVNLVVR
jgi:leucyl-tRNA synthetase